jgi:hypothetical protein
MNAWRTETRALSLAGGNSFMSLDIQVRRVHFVVGRLGQYGEAPPGFQIQGQLIVVVPKSGSRRALKEPGTEK